jgi:hypothetical protein
MDLLSVAHSISCICTPEGLFSVLTVTMYMYHSGPRLVSSLLRLFRAASRNPLDFWERFDFPSQIALLLPRPSQVHSPRNASSDIGCTGTHIAPKFSYSPPPRSFSDTTTDTSPSAAARTEPLWTIPSQSLSLGSGSFCSVNGGKCPDSVAVYCPAARDKKSPPRDTDARMPRRTS